MAILTITTCPQTCHLCATRILSMRVVCEHRPQANQTGNHLATELADVNKRTWTGCCAQVYCPFLLINKKRYAGLLYTKPERHDKMDTKVRTSYHLGSDAVRSAGACDLLGHVMVAG